VWQGVALAAAAAFAVGIAVRMSVGALEGAARLCAFAAISAVAASSSPGWCSGCAGRA
jgi:hypothetical protein